jgi:hypothetical protein
MTQNIITLESPVFLVAWSSMKEFLNPNNSARLANISIYPFSPKNIPDGYTLIGDAHISIILHDIKEINKNKIASLEIQKTQVMARAGAEVTRIEKQIQSLLAIEMS